MNQSMYGQPNQQPMYGGQAYAQQQAPHMLGQPYQYPQHP